MFSHFFFIIITEVLDSGNISGNAWRLIKSQKETDAPIALIAEISPKTSSTFLIKRQLVARIVFNSNFSCSNLKT